MKCPRCNEKEIPNNMIYSYRRIAEDRSISYCPTCWKIIEFEEVKFVKKPYKTPINRKGV